MHALKRTDGTATAARAMPKHNVDHLYKAPETLQKFYREQSDQQHESEISKGSKRKNWQEME
ncbi:hypothetical protein O5478_17685 [Escherichia coli]|nr:hypothetical protein [Escherichia coli]